jgi:hypothetical protein
LLTKKVSKKEKKGQSSGNNKLITQKSNDDGLFLAEFDSSPCLSSFKLTSCEHSTAQTSETNKTKDDVNQFSSLSSSSSSSVSVSPIGSSRNISPCLTNTHHDTTSNANKKGANLSKTSSIRSRGFSIPLNASVCLNTSNFLNYQPSASTRLASPPNGHVRFINYQLKQPIEQSHDDLVVDKSRHFCVNTDQYELDDEELINESIEFPIVNSFDLKKEVANSCLREVNLKLRCAQIKHVNDLTELPTQERRANQRENEKIDSSQFLVAFTKSQSENAQSSASCDYSQVNSQTTTIINPFSKFSFLYPSCLFFLSVCYL